MRVLAKVGMMVMSCRTTRTFLKIAIKTISGFCYPTIYLEYLQNCGYSMWAVELKLLMAYYENTKSSFFLFLFRSHYGDESKRLLEVPGTKLFQAFNYQ